MGAARIGHISFFINLGAAKCIELCEVTEPGKNITSKYIFQS